MSKKTMGFVNNTETAEHEMASLEVTSERRTESKQNGHDKSFTELVHESTKLPEIRAARLPMTMTNILRSPAKSESWKTNLPKLPLGQVHLVKDSSKTDEREKKEKRRKRERREKTRARRPPSPIPSKSISPSISPEKEIEYKSTWKKRLHKRSNKHIVSPDNDMNTVSCDLRLPALHEVRNVDLS